MFAKRHLAFQIFVMAFLAAMFLPRVLPEGMFPDGLTYAAIARNMAEGKGSFWSPYFSSSFWLPYQGAAYQFYGHPTLAMGILSLFFQIFGDHWLIEKGFCIFVWGLTAWLITKLWEVNAKDKMLWWLPLFAWYLMPTVLWAYPQFMLDNTMALFSLSASLLILKDQKSTLEHRKLQNLKSKSFIVHLWMLFTAGLLLHLAFLTKGPVGLYPLAMPFIYYLFYKAQGSLKKLVFQTSILMISCFGTLSLWYFYMPARLFWQKYLNTQLLSSISTNDQTENYTWLSYFYIPQHFILQGLPLLGIVFIFYIFSKTKKEPFLYDGTNNRLAAFYLTIALSGALPMMVSHKASAYYMVPCLPFLAMSFATFFEPTLISWFEKRTLSPLKTQKTIKAMVFLSILVFIYCLSLLGTIGREQDIIQDMKIMGTIVPKGEKLCVPDSMMKNINYHSYFQRYHCWELAKLSDTIPDFFVSSKGFSKKAELDAANMIFKKIDNDNLKILEIYRRK
jgi:4-amino-4-deoxy-L-arabinose transferase-like glycosyltransferase